MRSIAIASLLVGATSVFADDAGIASLFQASEIVCNAADQAGNVTNIVGALSAGAPVCDTYDALSADAFGTVAQTCGGAIGAINATINAIGSTETDTSILTSSAILLQIVNALDTKLNNGDAEPPMHTILKSDLLSVILKDFQCFLPVQITQIVQSLQTSVKNGGKVGDAIASTGLLSGGGISISNETMNCTTPEERGPVYPFIEAIVMSEEDLDLSDLPLVATELATVGFLATSPDFAQALGLSLAGAAVNAAGLGNNQTENEAAQGLLNFATAAQSLCLCNRIPEPALYGVDSILLRYLSHADFIPVWNSVFKLVSQVTNVWAKTSIEGVNTKAIVCGDKLKALSTGLNTAVGACGTAISPVLEQLSSLLLESSDCTSGLCGGELVPLLKKERYLNTEGVPLTEANVASVASLVENLDERVFGELAGVLTRLGQQCNPPPKTKAPTEEESFASTSSPALTGVVATLTAVGLLRQF